MICLNLWVSNVLAQVPPFLLDFPSSNRFNVGTSSVPDVRECFNLDNFKLLLKLKADHYGAQDQLMLLNQKLVLQSEVITVLQDSLKSNDEIIVIQNRRIDELFNKWSEENLKRLQAENKPVFGSWLAWGVAGVFLVSTAVVTGAYLAK
jgi:hypothetical protein